MIIRLIILGLLFVLQQMVNLLPVGNLPDGIYSSLALALGYLAGWDAILPVSELVEVLQWILIFQVTVWSWKGMVWVYGRIRGVSSV